MFITHFLTGVMIAVVIAIIISILKKSLMTDEKKREIQEKRLEEKRENQQLRKETAEVWKKGFIALFYVSILIKDFYVHLYHRIKENSPDKKIFSSAGFCFVVAYLHLPYLVFHASNPWVWLLFLGLNAIAILLLKTTDFYPSYWKYVQPTTNKIFVIVNSVQ